MLLMREISLKKTLTCQIKITWKYFFIPQISPCSWLNLLLTSNFLLYTLKLNLFFEKKC